MSTRSMIGQQVGDKINAIYCHHDGYLNHVGYILKDHYTNDKIVSELISLGSLSSLYENIKPKDGEEHSFEHPADNVTIAYHRDRGEDLYIDSFPNEEAYLDFLREDGGYEYAYLFKGGEWYYWTCYSVKDDSDEKGMKSFKSY